MSSRAQSDTRGSEPKLTKVLKFVIIGDPAVGKTSLRRTFMGRNFSQNYLPTLGADFSLHEMDYSGYLIKSTLWDLSGQPRFEGVHPQYYIGSHSAIVLYDVNTPNPIENLIRWIDTYLNHSNRFDTPILVVQNKIDLLDNNEEVHNKEEHNKRIDQLKIYYQGKLQILSAQTSAKTGENVMESLDDFIKTIVDWYLSGKEKITKNTHSEKLIDHVKSAYLIGFEGAIGPMIIAQLPETSQPEDSHSVVHLSAGLNMDELAERSFETGTFMWSKPPGILYYVAFLLENPDARGGYDLYILGCTVSRDLKNIIADERHIVDGHLISAMNQFSDFVNSTDYILSHQEEVDRLNQVSEDKYKINEILYEVRRDVDKLIKHKLQN